MSELDAKNLIKDGHFSPGVGILVCVPTLGRNICIEWANAYKGLNPPINYNMNIWVIKNQPVAHARNEAVKMALAKGHKYVFFMGDDTIPPGGILHRLIYRMEVDKTLGVVSGVYCSKSDPPYPLVFQEWGGGADWNWKLGEYFKVKGMGMDCTLIRTEMLREMKEPYFKTVDEDHRIDGIDHVEMWTEDLYFCEKVDKETSYTKYIDASIICGHYEHNSGKIITLPSDSYPVTGVVEVPKGNLSGIDIGAGGNPKSVKGYTMVTFDQNEDAKPDYRGDVRSLPFANSHFDLVYSSHVLEHLPKKDLDVTLDEWIRVLKKTTGIFVLKLPDAEWALKNLDNPKEQVHVSNVLYGAQQDSLDFHYNHFTKSKLEKLLKSRFSQLHVKKRDKYNLLAIASNRRKKLNFDSIEKLVIGD